MSNHRRGFTLIEMVIAIGLGIVLMLIAATALRAASLSVTTATRLSTENALLRAGFHEAHEQLDFWTAYDNPDVPSEQRLRMTRSCVGLMSRNDRTVGLPFTPLGAASGSMPAAGTVPRATSLRPRTREQLSDPTWEDDLGFDPSYVWAANDPRTWWAGAQVERSMYNKDMGIRERYGWWGRYALFTNTDAMPTMVPWPVIQPDKSVKDVDYSTPTPVPHRWLMNQIEGFLCALGFYGLEDYLPPNVPYATYTFFPPEVLGSGDADRWYMTFSGMPFSWCEPYDWTHFVVHLGAPHSGVDLPGSLYRATMPVCSLIEIPHQGDTDPTLDQLFQDHYREYDTDYSVSNLNYANASGGSANADARVNYLYFLNRTIHPVPVVALAPANWPMASVAVGHFFKNERPVSMCKVRWVSPVTGEIVELNFSSLGTSLRGARQQRRRDVGWAEWDPAATTNDPTLDTP